MSSLEIGNRSTAQSLRVGEIPLNGNGVPLTCNGEGVRYSPILIGNYKNVYIWKKRINKYL